MKKILVVDDEPIILDSLKYNLQRDGFEVSTAEDGIKALEILSDFDPDIVVLDVMLPEMDGFEVCLQIRTKSAVPVIMLTARSDELDRIQGLDTGADDYLVKPFSYKELRSRIRAVLRRVELDQNSQTKQILQIGPVKIDIGARQIMKQETNLQLATREFDVLAYLMLNAGQAVSRGDLLDNVWGPGWIGAPHTLDVHIRWLRIKLEEDPAKPVLIQTIRGFGYRFINPEELAQ